MKGYKGYSDNNEMKLKINNRRNFFEIHKHVKIKRQKKYQAKTIQKKTGVAI